MFWVDKSFNNKSYSCSKKVHEYAMLCLIADEDQQALGQDEEKDEFNLTVGVALSVPAMHIVY